MKLDNIALLFNIFNFITLFIRFPYRFDFMVIHRSKKAYLPLLVLSLLIGCSPKAIFFVNEKAYDRQSETYFLVIPKIEKNLKEQPNESRSLYAHLEELIKSEMQRKGYQYSTINPDLTLRYEITSSTRTESNTFRDPFRPTFQVSTRTIREGVLWIEAYNAKNKIVWQGSYNLNPARKEKRLQEVLKNAVFKIVETYPFGLSK